MDKKVLFSVLDQVSTKYPGNVAIEEAGRKTTYSELKDNSNRVANCLIASKLQKAEEVGAFLKCGATYVSTILGINKVGGIFMALDVEYPIKRMEYILNHVKPRIVITDEENLPKFLNIVSELELSNSFIKEVIVVSGNDTMFKTGYFVNGEFTIKDINFYPETEVELTVTGDDSIYLVNTSGSTGNPKMIEGCHKSLSHFIHWEVNDFNLDTSTRGCILARLSFDLSLREMFAPLLAGGTLCIPEPDVKVQPLKLIEWLGASRINLIHPIPSIFRQVMKEIKSNPELAENVLHLKNILFAGEALFGRDITDWRSIGGEKASLANLYGPSETTLAKICHRINENIYQPNEIIPLGKPLPNTSILIISDGLLCSPNVIGEIFIKTPFRSKGYYKEPGMTKEKFIQNPLHDDYEDIVYQTGDLAKYFEDGTIAFTGRQDSQVKIRGNRVELSEIEKAILNYPDIKQAIVLPVKNADGDNVLTCYYVGDAYFDKEKLRTYLKDYLPEYMFPSFYIHLDEFPLNLNGKIDRRALPKPEELLYDQLTFEAPGNELEEKLSVIWANVLNLKKVGINNSFYELGGHSLSVTKVLSRIYKELGIEISLKDIFNNPTIKKLAALLSGKKASVYKAIEKVQPQEFYDLSYAQKAIWVLDQTEENLTAYNIPAAFFLYGALDINAFKQAFGVMIKRHESLRTTFVFDKGEPKQKIHGQINFEVEYIKDHIRGNEEEASINKYFEPESSRGFDLANGPLFRALLVEVAEDKHLLLFTVHHIIADGWSIMVFINEITTLYNVLRAGKPNPLQSLKIQYKDYASWQSEFLTGNKQQVLKDYWSDKLSGDISLVEFPADFPRLEDTTLNGNTEYFDVDAKTTREINDLNLKYGTTNFIAFLAYINVLLYKYTGKSDLIVGTPLAGRDHVDLEDQIGIYVNVLPIRTFVEANDTFLTLLDKVRKTVFETYEHQLYPFDLITGQLEQKGRKKNLPIIDILVQSQNMVPVYQNTVSEIYVKQYPLNNKTSKVDLTFDFSPNAGNTNTISIEYNSNLFTPATISGIKDNITHIIKESINDPEIKIGDIQLINSAEDAEEYESFKKTFIL
jgi:amino acid adenylation domain-containing protein